MRNPQTPPARQCPKCHATYQAGEDFCGADGSRLVEKPPPQAWVRPEDLLGQALGGRFVLNQVLGGTDTAVVYRATHQRLEKEFAVKLLRRAFLRNDKMVQRFLREARVASTMDHPHIVNIYDFGLTELGEPYLVMEFVDGISLRQVLAASPGGRLPVSQAIDVAIQVARALGHVHGRGVVHRNLKPENIVLTHRDGHADFVKVLDLGVAKRTGQPNLTQNGEIIGTAELIAPEAWSWSDAVPPVPAIDQYALGILLYMMIAGRPPFVGERGEIMMEHLRTVPPRLSAQARAVEIPPDLDALAAQLLEKDPALRPDAEATLARLEQIQAQLPPHSLRSLLLQRTLILSPHERDTFRKNPPSSSTPAAPAFSHQQTVLLDRPQQQGTALILPEEPPAGRTSLAVLGQVDALEDEIERTRRRMAEYTDAYAARAWQRGWPPDAAALRAQITSQEAEEETLGIHLAVREEQLRQLRQEEQQRRSNLRLRILDLSQRLQGLPPPAPGAAPPAGDTSGAVRLREVNETEQGVLAAALADAERAYGTLEQPGDVVLQQAIESEQRQLQALRGQTHADWLRLSRMVLQVQVAPALTPERRKLEQLVEQLEAASAALAKLLEAHKLG